MIKKYFSVSLFLFIFSFGFSQQRAQLSVYSEISIITVGPGDKLYEAFGHSALRIKDPVLNIDLVYNYGIFDFNAPHFYTNFVKGKLLYKLARYPFSYFKDDYQHDKRWVKEQVLDLTQTEKQRFFVTLEHNALPKFATYLYDPYFNNCATKMLDISKKVLANKVSFDDRYYTKKLSYRQLMHQELPWNTWGSFGIDLALGSKLDQIADAKGATYLPDYVFKAFKHAVIFQKNQPKKLVKKTTTVLNFPEKKPVVGLFNPLLIFSLLSLIGLWITYKDFKKKKRTQWLDFILFFSTGILGSFIVFLWFFTNHSTTPNNFNFLWTFAPNLVIAFLVKKEQPKKWLKYYIYLLLLFLLAIPFIWIGKIQLLPPAIIPVLILLLIRYLFLIKTLLSFKE